MALQTAKPFSFPQTLKHLQFYTQLRARFSKGITLANI